MKKIFPAQMFQTMEEGEENADMDTQETNGNVYTEQSKDSKKPEGNRKHSMSQYTSADMVTELNNIEQQNSLPTDPNHDKTIKESSTSVR